MAARKQNTIDGSSPAADTADKPKKTAKPKSESGSSGRITNAKLDAKYNEILDVLRGNAAKIDDIIAAGGAFAAPVREVSAGTSGEDMSKYMTSREQFEGYQKVINRRDGEFAEKSFLHLLEQICALREDYTKLCNTMQPNIGTLTAEEVLTSFRAYIVDIENMLTDAGIKFGTFGAPGSQVNTDHQRIVSVVPTTDPSRNGTVAQRLSSGYQYQGRTIVKERVVAYKTAKKV